MNRYLARLSLVSLFVAATLLGGAGSAGAGRAWVDPALQTQLTALSPVAQVIAIANFDPAVTTAAAVASNVQNTGAGTYTFNNLDSVGVLATSGQIGLIANVAGVTEIYANRQLAYLMAESNSFIGADRVWEDLGITGKGIGVAILDSGVDATHPDLAFGTKTVQNVKFLVNQTDLFTTKGRPATGPAYLENVSDTDTTSGHGTHVAGISAGNGAASGGFYKGVAPGANIVGLGTGETLFIFWILAGFDYILDHRVQYNIKVVNNSWGGEGGSGAWDPKDPINKATKKVHDEGVTVVFAAGNSGPDPDTMNPYAEAPWVISAAAGCVPEDTVGCPDGLLTDFSSRGLPGSAQFHPTLTAPGYQIVSTRASTGTTLNALDATRDLTICHISQSNLSEYTCASGTSMATPHVVGAVALMQEKAGGRLSPDQVKSILTETARPMVKNDGTPYAPFEVGAGYMDVFAAVSASE
jgi:serine protease AprX